MTQPTETPAETALPDVYVLSVDYRDGSTNIVRVSTDLDDLFNHYGPDSFSPTQQWHPVTSTFDPGTPVSLWETRFATGNDGAHLWIRCMPLHGRPAPKADADGLLDNYDPSLSLVARGVMADPIEPTDADEPHAPAATQAGCVQCQGVNSEQCPRCEFEAEYDADVTALSTLIADAIAANQTPDKMARTILASDWLDEANDRLVTPMIEGATARLRERVLTLIPTDNPELLDAGYTILASDVLDRLDATATTQAAPPHFSDPAAATPADLQAFRRDFFIRVDITDADLRYLLNEHRDALATSRQWGWNDTAVRDRFTTVLEANGYTLDH